MRDTDLEDRKINYERRADGERLQVCYIIMLDAGDGHEDLEAVCLSVEDAMQQADGLAREETHSRNHHLVYEYNIGPEGDPAPRLVHYGDAEA